MPSQKILEQKQQYVAEITEKLNNSVAGVVVNYRGITVADDTKLRAELRAAGVDYFVAKNTLLGRAATEAGLDGLNEVLEGTTAIAVSAEDHVAAAKIISKFIEEKGKTVKSYEIKAGYVEGKVIDKAGVEALAKLPPREILVAQVLGGLNAPISGLVTVLNGNIRGLACVLNAIAEKQGA